MFVFTSGLDVWTLLQAITIVSNPGCGIGSSKEFLDHAAKHRRCLPHSRIVSVAEKLVYRCRSIGCSLHKSLAPAALMHLPGCFGSREFPLIEPLVRCTFEGLTRAASRVMARSTGTAPEHPTSCLSKKCQQSWRASLVSCVLRSGPISDLPCHVMRFTRAELT